MKKLNSLLGIFGFCLLILNMESCSSHKGMVSCPDLHHAFHHQMAMHKPHYKAGHTAVAKSDVKEQPQNNGATAGKVERQAVIDAPKSAGIASLSNEVPVVKGPKEMFKLLTADERLQVKDELSNMFSKKPMLKNIAMKKFDKLDKKYPAPAESVLKGGGGGLGTGEILAIVAIVLSLTFFLSIAGMIIGIIALIKLKHDGGAEWAKILAIVAIILGALLFLFFLIWLIAVVILAGAFL